MISLCLLYKLLHHFVHILLLASKCVALVLGRLLFDSGGRANVEENGNRGAVVQRAMGV